MGFDAQIRAQCIPEGVQDGIQPGQRRMMHLGVTCTVPVQVVDGEVRIRVGDILPAVSEAARNRLVQTRAVSVGTTTTSIELSSRTDGACLHFTIYAASPASDEEEHIEEVD